MPLVHIEHTVSRGSLRQWMFRLLSDLWSRLPGCKCWHEALWQSSWSGAVLSSGAEADTLCSSRISVRGDTEARRAHETDGGLHFYRPLTVCWRRIVVSHAEIKSPRIKSSFWGHCRVSPLCDFHLHPSLSLSSSSSLGCGFKYSDAPRGLVSSYSALLFPVCQLLPLTQPSGASFSADVLRKKAHGNVSTHTPVSKMRFQCFLSCFLFFHPLTHV